MADDTHQLDFFTLDVFTDTRFLGNPLAVVLVPASARDRVSQDTKQRIAREFNLSETVFLHTPDGDGDAPPPNAASALDIDIFTPEEELPFAGHPTIGTAQLVLHHLDWQHVHTLHTRAGPIPIAPGVSAAIPHDLHVHGQTLGGLLAAPSTSERAAETIRRGLSADAAIRAAELAAPVVSIVRGMTFLLVRVPSLDHLGRAAPVGRIEYDAVPELLDEGGWGGGFVARYYYCVVPGEGSGAVAIRTRMVELEYEDPATGSAACTLAGYLAMCGQGDKFAITQGVEMGRRSEIVVRTTVEEGEDGESQVDEMYLGGTAVVVMRGSISV